MYEREVFLCVCVIWKDRLRDLKKYNISDCSHYLVNNRKISFSTTENVDEKDQN